MAHGKLCERKSRIDSSRWDEKIFLSIRRMIEKIKFEGFGRISNNDRSEENKILIRV